MLAPKKVIYDLTCGGTKHDHNCLKGFRAIRAFFRDLISGDPRKYLTVERQLVGCNNYVVINAKKSGIV